MYTLELDREEMFAVQMALTEMVAQIDRDNPLWHEADDDERGLRAVAANLYDNIKDEATTRPSMQAIMDDIRPKHEIFPGTYEQLRQL